MTSRIPFSLTLEIVIKWCMLSGSADLPICIQDLRAVLQFWTKRLSNEATARPALPDSAASFACLMSQMRLSIVT
jgi:hypothetical protein